MWKNVLEESGSIKICISSVQVRVIVDIVQLSLKKEKTRVRRTPRTMTPEVKSYSEYSWESNVGVTSNYTTLKKPSFTVLGQLEPIDYFRVPS